MSAILVALAIMFNVGNPLVDQRCLNPAYEHMHASECSGAINPSDYSD